MKEVNHEASVGLEHGEVLGLFQPLQQPLPVLEVQVVVLDARVEGLGQAVLPQVLLGEDAEGLADRVLLGPQLTQLGDGVDVALVLLDGEHELLLVEAEVGDHPLHPRPVLADVAEDGLAEVLDHVLGLGLLLLLAELRALLHLVKLPHLPLTVGALVLEVPILLHLHHLAAGLALVHDLDVVAELLVLLGVRARAEPLLGDLLIAGHLVVLVLLLEGVGGRVGARALGAQLLVEDVLLVQQLHDEHVLGVNHLHHLHRGREAAGVRSQKVGVRGVGSAEARGSAEGFGRGVHRLLRVLLGKNNARKPSRMLQQIYRDSTPLYNWQNHVGPTTFYPGADPGWRNLLCSHS